MPMKNLSIDQAEYIYHCTKDCIIHKHVVDHLIFHNFCTAIRNLEYDLSEQTQDPYWKEIFHEIKKYQYMLYATPIPFHMQIKPLIQFLENNIKNCEHFFPSFLTRLQALVNTALLLSEQQSNPLLEQLASILIPENQQTTAILSKGIRASLLDNEDPLLQNIEIVNHYQLRGSHCYQQLIVIGPHHWYPDYIFRAPRAKEIHFIRYSWISEIWRVQPFFIQPTSFSLNNDQNHQLNTNRAKNNSNIDTNERIIEQERFPEINWHRLSNKLIKNVRDDNPQEIEQAKLYLLANDYAVFLEDNDSGHALILDLETGQEEETTEEGQSIKRLLISKIQSGMFILLRTNGGGDAIISIADTLLGNEATRVRTMQEEWKKRLRKAVKDHGLFSVCITLLDYEGSALVNEMNLSNWMSNKSIKPRNDKDFSAILRFVGLYEDEAMYKEAANKIDNAHRRAGFNIRRQLMKQVVLTDPHDIQKKGYWEFDLSGPNGGSLTAFRIEQISPDVSTISASRIGRPILAKDFL